MDMQFRRISAAALILICAIPGAAGRAHAQDPAPPGVAAEVRPQEPAPAEDDAPAPEDAPKPRPRFRIGPEFGAYFPASAKTRSRFGQAWQQFSLGLGAIQTPKDGGVLSLDVTFLGNSRGENRATIIPIGLQYRRGLLAGAGRWVRPYVGVGGGLVLAQLRSAEDGVTSRLRGGYGFGATLGTTFGDSGFVEAGYRATTRIRDFDLSGASLSLGFRF